MTQSEFWAMLYTYMQAHKGQRIGQASFNMLYGIFPEEVDRLSATELDPFYNDNNLEAFLNKLGIY